MSGTRKARSFRPNSPNTWKASVILSGAHRRVAGLDGDVQPMPSGVEHLDIVRVGLLDAHPKCREVIQHAHVVAIDHDYGPFDPRL